MSIGRLDNMYQLWGILILAGLGVGRHRRSRLNYHHHHLPRCEYLCDN